eukprot:SAG31_NODE_40507_length_280_cov_0.856354_1_plen_20_part_10
MILIRLPLAIPFALETRKWN